MTIQSDSSSKTQTLIIAEAGVNHNGSIEIAKQLIDAAVEVKANVVKFQTWKTENIATENAEKASYQKAETGIHETQYEMLKHLELDYSSFSELNKYARTRGIIFASTPDDEESVDFLDSINIPFFKIGSGEITNLSFLRHVAGKKKPLILSTGMSSLGEVERAVDVIKAAQAATGVSYLSVDGFAVPPLTLLHCVSSYPAPVEESNLRVIQSMGITFKVPIGYSDHSEETAVCLAAVALGAVVIEKHFTLDKKMPGPDHSASFDPVQFKAMVQSIKNVEKALGDGIKRMMPSERDTCGLVRKKLVAACDILANAAIIPEMIAAKRAAGGIPVEWRDMVIGRKTKKAVKKDEILEWGILS
jgi:N,N'-diacetyllegionaminate synthase